MDPCSTIWVARADDSFVCFGAKADKRFFGPEISPYPEVVRGHEKRAEWKKELRGSWRRDSREASQQRVGVEPRTDAVDSGDSSREDRVQRKRSSQEMPAFQLLCGIFASNPR